MDDPRRGGRPGHQPGSARSSVLVSLTTGVNSSSRPPLPTQISARTTDSSCICAPPSYFNERSAVRIGNYCERRGFPNRTFGVAPAIAPDKMVRGSSPSDGGKIPPDGYGCTPVRARCVSPARGVAGSASRQGRGISLHSPRGRIGLAPAVRGRGHTGRAIGLSRLSATVARLARRRGWIGRAVTPSRVSEAEVL